jgi:hypothetical protein
MKEYNRIYLMAGRGPLRCPEVQFNLVRNGLHSEKMPFQLKSFAYCKCATDLYRMNGWPLLFVSRCTLWMNNGKLFLGIFRILTTDIEAVMGINRIVVIVTIFVLVKNLNKTDQRWFIISPECHNSRQNIVILFWKYLVDRRSEARLIFSCEYIN